MENDNYEQYEFQYSHKYVQTGSIKNDLYQVIKAELAYMLDNVYEQYLDKLSMSENDKMSDFYSDFLNIVGRLTSCLNDIKIGSISEYVKYFTEHFNKQMFSVSYVKETEVALSCLTQFDVITTRLVYDILSKMPAITYNADFNPFLVIENYFAYAKNPMFPNFLEYLNTCHDVIYDTIRRKI